MGPDRSFARPEQISGVCVVDANVVYDARRKCPGMTNHDRTARDFSVIAALQCRPAAAVTGYQIPLLRISSEKVLARSDLLIDSDIKELVVARPVEHAFE